MGCCCSMPAPINIGCNNEFEQKTKSLWLEIIGKDNRKAIKLLARQYEIESIVVNAPEYHDDTIVRDSPMIITYYHYTNPRQKFEWIIEPRNFYLH